MHIRSGNRVVVREVKYKFGGFVGKNYRLLVGRKQSSQNIVCVDGLKKFSLGLAARLKSNVDGVGRCCSRAMSPVISESAPSTSPVRG
jgi:hypothetical protein